MTMFICLWGHQTWLGVNYRELQHVYQLNYPNLGWLGPGEGRGPLLYGDRAGSEDGGGARPPENGDRDASVEILKGSL